MLFLAACSAALWSLASVAAEVSGQSANPQTLLPDGTPFNSWDDLTHYTRTYHVSQSNPQASDENDGTEEHPFRTINHAADVVKPGERVWIHTGVYRELVRPRFSGEGPDRMIAYEAAPGEQVIIRGSRVITTRWEWSVDPNRLPEAPGAPDLNVQLRLPANIYSKQLWMTTLPDSLFENGFFPFRTPNVKDADFAVMTWARRWKGRVPYSLPRGMLFQDGRRMDQFSAYEEHSVAMSGDVTFDENLLQLSWKSALTLPTAPLVKRCELDFFGCPRVTGRNISGPFLGLANSVMLQLRAGIAAREPLNSFPGGASR